MRLSRGGYLIREGFRSIKTHSFMSFASVTIIMACLIIMGSVFLLSMNIDHLIGDMEDQNEVVALVDESYSSADAQALQMQVESVPNVADAEFVDRAVAMDTFMNNFDSDFRDGIDETVFRHRFVIHLDDISLMSQTKSELESVEGIVKVKAHLEYANAFITIRNIVSVVSLVLTVILVFVSVFIMSNTIKLATFGRREEIGIMKMIGATDGFIRAPFFIESLILSLLAAAVAFGLQYLIGNALLDSGLASISFIKIADFKDYMVEYGAVFAGIAVIIGVCGSLLSIRKFLRV